jgi:C4-dicarboxylate transporter, DctQ subunit
VIDAALRALRRVERVLLAGILLVLSAAFVVNIAVRSLLPAHASTFAWVDEFGVFALAWLVFLGLGLALERRQHIAMTALRESLGRRAERIITVLVNLTGLVFCLYLAKLGLDIALLVARSGQISPILNVSMVWLYAVVPLGFLLLALRYLLLLCGVVPPPAEAGTESHP